MAIMKLLTKTSGIDILVQNKVNSTIQLFYTVRLQMMT